MIRYSEDLANTLYLFIIVHVLFVSLLHHLPLPSLLFQSLLDELSHLALLAWLLPTDYEPEKQVKSVSQQVSLKNIHDHKSEESKHTPTSNLKIFNMHKHETIQISEGERQREGNHIQNSCKPENIL